MKKRIAVILLLAAACSLFGWGSGHNDHAGLVLKYLPKEIDRPGRRPFSE